LLRISFELKKIRLKSVDLRYPCCRQDSSCPFSRPFLRISYAPQAGTWALSDDSQPLTKFSRYVTQSKEQHSQAPSYSWSPSNTKTSLFYLSIPFPAP
jgi:hypothetical protein